MSDAIPTLDSGNDVPVAVRTGKTNVGTLALMLMVALMAVSLVAGSIWFLMSGSDNDELQTNLNIPKTNKPNEAIDSQAIANKQAQLMEQQRLKREAEERAAIEAKQREEAQRLLELQKARAAAETAEFERKRREGQLAAARNQQAQPARTTSSEESITTPQDRRRTGEVFFNVDSGSVGNQAQDITNGGGIADILGGVATGGTESQSESVFGQTATTFSARSAGRLPDLDYLLKTGTTIPCALVTKVNTTLAGLTICRVTKDIYSANGNTLLIERGAQVTGQQTRAVVNGDARTFVLWTRIDNDSGVSIDIDSPVAGQLGESGMEAFVDNHFWERFGTAIMVSLIDDVSQYIIAKESTSDGGTSFTNSTESGSNLATEILERQADIQPNGITNNARLVNIIVARDVSFNNVYRLLK